MEEQFGAWIDTDDGTRDIRVLHVDDETDVTEMTGLMLERESEHFEVVSENAPSDAIERLPAIEVDCILSDYQMPGTNGLEFFERVSETHPELPFILFTGKGSEEVASDAFSLGVTDYFQKEVGADQYTVLANRIQQAVSRCRSQQRLERARRRFKTLVEEATDAILVVDEFGEILYATPASSHVLGRSPEELVGTSGFEPVHPEDAEAVGDELSRLLEDPEYRARVEFRYHHADGSWVPLEIRGRNLLDHDDIAGIVVYARSIDERSGDGQADG